MSLDVLERINDRLSRIEADITLVRREVQRLATALAERDVDCARCRTQLADTLPAGVEP